MHVLYYKEIRFSYLYKCFLLWGLSCRVAFGLLVCDEIRICCYRLTLLGVRKVLFCYAQWDQFWHYLLATSMKQPIRFTGIGAMYLCFTVWGASWKNAAEIVIHLSTL
ncbi:hypothetical protein L6452_09163 [Arctium lappa]|uniref:Uncharacterized protein n=1 Tax=Arctium lappa TaxID=4217 RepID=A0ACB9DJ81_ARCLA|nr:hypothetical protein L6452_09163 [Arctium lappa]